MPKRKIDPNTGEAMLTAREEKLIHEFLTNGGNGTRAAASASYSAARPSDSAYQVLHRPEVQRRIRERIEEWQVSAHEIIGTLASYMRGSLGDFFDESGDFSIQAAKQKGIDHLLKSVTVTIREIPATRDKPAQVVRTFRGQIHSPVQTATALARILSVDFYTTWLGGRPARRAHCETQPSLTDHDSPNNPQKLNLYQCFRNNEGWMQY